MPIPLEALAPPRFFYLYRNTPDTGPLFTICDTQGAELVSVSFRRLDYWGLWAVRASFKLDAWTYKDERATLTRLFNGVSPAGSHRALQRFLLTLKRNKIPRYTQVGKDYLPWSQRNDAENFLIARNLIVHRLGGGNRP